MKKEKIKEQKIKQKKPKSEARNMLIGVGLGILFGFIFNNFILGAIMAIVVVMVLEIGVKDK